MTLPAALLTTAVSTREPKCYSKDVNAWFCLDYVRDRSDEITEATTTHVQITVAAVLLGLLIAFPLALLARRYPRLESTVLGVSTGLYTVPSLALLPLLVPLTGLTKTTVVIGLGLYCLTILVRAFLDGLRSVPDEVRESATGLGYGRAKLLLKIELPLALPVIMAGLRVATVSTVALTTIGTVVSEGGLGFLIAEGKSTQFNAELMTGAVLCVVLALVLDLLLVLAQRLLTPWARQGVRA
ncbi:ABC transporter permease [Nocardioides sp. 503]|uniref:ABC transporter permease n=1 Tax=Nocardioides sp. 503 TaxID=2508326 RepID=UPI001FD71077|nr:ABC transporter permease [Nocardioides sp. 503]